jgi:hypothetical protein
MPQNRVMDPRLALAAEDDERRSLERALHDGPQQRLIALAVELQLAVRALESEPDTAARYLADARVQAQEALDELRRAAVGIHPPLLDTHGLRAALQAAGARVHGEIAEPLPPVVAVTVYRCCVAVMAGAAATVTVGTDAACITFEVDGDPSGAERLEPRVRALGGELRRAPRRLTGRLPLSGGDRRDT